MLSRSLDDSSAAYLHYGATTVDLYDSALALQLRSAIRALIDDLRTIAVSRLLLDNIDHIKAYWIGIGEKVAQVAQSFGADDLGGTIVDERIFRMAGAQTDATAMSRDRLERLIRDANREPVETDPLYNPLEPRAA